MISPEMSHVSAAAERADDDDPCRPAVGEADDPGLTGVGGLDKADHALDGAVLADLYGLHLESTELVDCAGGHLVADSLVDRQRFARHDGLIDGRLTGHDLAVNGDGLTGQHAQQVADLDFFSRNDVFFAA